MRDWESALMTDKSRAMTQVESGLTFTVLRRMALSSLALWNYVGTSLVFFSSI